jgi:hypothetical protein
MSAAKPTRAAVGMTLDQAADLIRCGWLEYLDAPERDYDDDDEGKIVWDKPVMFKLLRGRSRDCGWCIIHSHGDSGLMKLHNLAIKGLTRKQDQGGLSSALNHAFHGIGTWLA